jgi:hypothetical protein
LDPILITADERSEDALNSPWVTHYRPVHAGAANMRTRAAGLAVFAAN